MDCIRTKHLRIMHGPAPSMPRAWTANDRADHFAKLYTGTTEAELTTAMRKAFTEARHPHIPAAMQDMLYKILVSGHNTGARHTCKRCENCSEDTLEHAYA